MTKSIITTTGIVLLSINLLAQNLITGRVVEKGTNEALPLANVINENSGKGVVTNTEGYFTIYAQETDSIRLKITYVGYQSMHIRISRDNNPKELQIEF